MHSKSSFETVWETTVLVRSINHRTWRDCGGHLFALLHFMEWGHGIPHQISGISWDWSLLIINPMFFLCYWLPHTHMVASLPPGSPIHLQSVSILVPANSPCTKTSMLPHHLQQWSPTFFGTRDGFHGRQFFHWPRLGGMVSGWFKCITFIVHFISNIMLPLTWQEVPVQGLEVGDHWLSPNLQPSSWGCFHPGHQLHHPSPSTDTTPSNHMLMVSHLRLVPLYSFLLGYPVSVYWNIFQPWMANATSPPSRSISHIRDGGLGVGLQLLIPHYLWREKSCPHHPTGRPWPLSERCSVVSNCLWLHGLYSPWNSPDQNTGVGSWSLLQGIFPTQGSNQRLLHCRQILYQLSHLP